MVLKLVKSWYICGGTNLTQKDYDSENSIIQRDIIILDKSQRVYMDCKIERTKAKRLCDALVECKEDEQWFPYVLLLFHLSKAGVTSWGEDTLVLKISTSQSGIDEIDSVLNCI